MKVIGFCTSVGGFIWENKMIRWFGKKIKRIRISSSFALELLPPLTTASRDLSIMRHRIDRIQQKDITELSVADLMLHIDNMSYSLIEIESHILNCKDRITRERQ